MWPQNPHAVHFCFASCCPSGLWSLCHWNCWIDYLGCDQHFVAMVLILVFCVIWAIRANVRIVCLIWVFWEFEIFIRLCCTSLMTLVLCCSLFWKFTVLSALSVWHDCVPCVSPLLVLTDRLDLLSSFPTSTWGIGDVLSWHGYPGPLLAPSSGSGRKAICIMFLPSSLSPSFILQISCAETGGAILGFIFGVGYCIFCWPF